MRMGNGENGRDMESKDRRWRNLGNREYAVVPLMMVEMEQQD